VRISEAITGIEAAHPELGRHLRRSVRTWSFCVYDPADPTDWRLRRRGAGRCQAASVSASRGLAPYLLRFALSSSVH
jgi:hypothetical protein